MLSTERDLKIGLFLKKSLKCISVAFPLISLVDKAKLKYYAWDTV